jgi:hypothetical protein
MTHRGDREVVTKETPMQDLQISANCPDCGEVDLTAEQLWLVLTSATGNADYHFLCPGCTAHVRHHADQATVDLLAPLVAVEERHIPAEALESHVGSPLTLDDLIDLLLGLESFAEAAQPAGSAAFRPDDDVLCHRRVARPTKAGRRRDDRRQPAAGAGALGP